MLAFGLVGWLFTVLVVGIGLLVLVGYLAIRATTTKAEVTPWANPDRAAHPEWDDPD